MQVHTQGGQKEKMRRIKLANRSRQTIKFVSPSLYGENYTLKGYPVVGGEVQNDVCTGKRLEKIRSISIKLSMLRSWVTKLILYPKTRFFHTKMAYF